MKFPGCSVWARAAALVVASLLPLTVGCGGDAAPPATAWKTPSGPRWQDVFVTAPDVLLMVHPAELSRDPVYGPVVKSALRVALARSAHIASSTMLEAVQSAEMVVVGKSGDNEAVDGVVVLRGVRADLDPARITGDGGGAMWRPVAQQSAVPEYAGGSDASLFDLGQRTWVVAAGARRQEARQAFAHPFGRPLPFEEDGALALLRMRGETMTNIAPQQMRYGNLAPVAKHLSTASLELRPGGEGALVAAFVYRDDESSAFAEATLRDVARALSTPGADGKPPWIRSAEVTHEARTITVKANIAGRLLDTMKMVGAR